MTTASPPPSARRAPGHRAGSIYGPPPTDPPLPPAGGVLTGQPVPPDPLPTLTLDDLHALLQERRTAVHAEVAALIAAGEPVAVPADAVFLCELLGLVVDLRTGVICAYADEYVTPRMPLSELRRIIDGG